jgi:hypothetical protein
MDDFPVALFTDRGEALHHAVVLATGNDGDLPPRKIQDIFRVNATKPQFVDVYEFSEGFPKQRIGSVELA